MFFFFSAECSADGNPLEIVWVQVSIYLPGEKNTFYQTLSIETSINCIFASLDKQSATSYGKDEKIEIDCIK